VIKMHLTRGGQKILKYLVVVLTLTCIITSLWKVEGTSHSGLIINDHQPRVELEDLEGLPQNDTFLIGYLRQHHLYPPSSRGYRYSQLHRTLHNYINYSRTTTRIIQKYLKNKTNGVFVEAGANNGADELSNTLVLERDYNWTGLLVEGSPLVFPKLLSAHRKSWKSDLLLSKYPHTQLIVFKQGDNIYAGRDDVEHPLKSSLDDSVVAAMAEDGKTPVLNFEVLTVPLYSLVAACKIDVIDFFSLDLEGTEFEILRNFPFDKVLIRTMIVEVSVLGRFQWKYRIQELVDFLSSKGYRKHQPDPTPRDILFIHESLLNQ